ncbi:hypothetical protein BVRB_1g011540 [Beta vulgaris subsp. vulgaris]|nr:hypothetical protein BVRB_1g011540 [Beta vulgaris subsp. vulgaris]
MAGLTSQIAYLLQLCMVGKPSIPLPPSPSPRSHHLVL